MLIGIRHTYPINWKRSALIVSLRTMAAIVIAATVAIVMPAMADNHQPPPAASVAAASDTGNMYEGVDILGWVKGKAAKVKEVATDKWRSATDPDERVKDLQLRLASLEAENAELKRTIQINDDRAYMLSSDREELEEAVRSLSVLFASGRMDHLVKEIADASPKLPEVQ